MGNHMGTSTRGGVIWPQRMGFEELCPAAGLKYVRTACMHAYLHGRPPYHACAHMQAACKSSRPGQTYRNPIGRGQITSPHVHVPLFLPMDWPHPARGLPLAIAWRPTSCMRAYASGMQIKPAGANVPKSHRAGPNHVASCACALILAHGLAASRSVRRLASMAATSYMHARICNLKRHANQAGRDEATKVPSGGAQSHRLACI